VPFDGEKSVHFDDTDLFEGRPFHFIKPESEPFSDKDMEIFLEEISHVSKSIIDDVDTDYEFGCLLERVLLA